MNAISMEVRVTSADKNVGEKVVEFLECSCFQAFMLQLIGTNKRLYIIARFVKIVFSCGLTDSFLTFLLQKRL